MIRTGEYSPSDRLANHYLASTPSQRAEIRRPVPYSPLLLVLGGGYAGLLAIAVQSQAPTYCRQDRQAMGFSPGSSARPLRTNVCMVRCRIMPTS